MAEFQELKVSVTFTDNASDKLKDVNAQLAKLGTGGDVNRKAVEGFKVSTDLVSKLATEVRGVANAFNLFGGLPIFKLGAGTGFAGIVLAIKQTNDALGAFAKELLALRDMSRSAGLLPDQFKNVSNQLKLVGYTSDEASREVLSFVRTIDEASRPGTSQFMRIYEMSATPELAMSRIKQMRDLIRSGQPGQAIVLAAREARAIYERELNSRGMQEARRQAESWLASVGLSMRALGISDISDFLGDPQKWQRRIEAAERFNVEYEKFNKVLGGLITDIKMELLPLFEDLNKALSAGAFDSVLASIKTDAADFRKIIALLEGDYAKLASLLPKGPARRAALNLAEQMRRDLETEGEKKAPTASGRIEQFRQRQRSYRDWKDKQLENNEEGYGLLEELKRLNSILFQLQAAKDAAKAPAVPPFHNAPQGGAQGESNPMQLPLGHPQPGGGAPAEARRGRAPRTSVFGVPFPQPRRPEAQIASASGPLETLGAIRTGGRVYSFGAEGRGREQAEAQEAGSGLEGLYGLSYTQQQEPEVFYKPGTGQETTTIGHEFGHVGRETVRMWGAAGTGNILQRYGANLPPPDVAKFGENEAEERLQRMQDIHTATRLIDSGLIGPEEFQARLKRSTDRFGQISEKDYGELSRHATMQERAATTILNQGAEAIKNLPVRPEEPFQFPQGAPMPEGQWSPVYGEESDLPGFRDQLDRANSDRGGFDGALAAEANIDASANLDVNVRGPAGVDVKANGDGMFKGNTSVSRQVELQ